MGAPKGNKFGKNGGHPVKWNPDKKREAIELIFNRIAEGESVRSILDKGDKTIYPSWVTFNEWLSADKELAKQYVRTCELRADKIFDEIFEIADALENDVITTKEGLEVVNHNVINRDRLRVDARKWALSKMNPKKYGDKIRTKHSGKIKTKTLTITTLTDDELNEKINEIKNRTDK